MMMMMIIIIISSCQSPATSETAKRFGPQVCHWTLQVYLPMVCKHTERFKQDARMRQMIDRQMTDNRPHYEELGEIACARVILPRT